MSPIYDVLRGSGGGPTHRRQDVLKGSGGGPIYRRPARRHHYKHYAPPPWPQEESKGLTALCGGVFPVKACGHMSEITCYQCYRQVAIDPFRERTGPERERFIGEPGV